MDRKVRLLLVLVLLCLQPIYCLAQRPELVIQTGNAKETNSLSFSPDGKLLATGSDRGKLWDAQTGAELRTFIASGGAFEQVIFSTDGKTLISVNGWPSNTILIWDVVTGKQVQALIGGDNTFYGPIVLSPDGKLLASADELKNEITLWDIRTGKELRKLTWPLTADSTVEGVESLAFSPDGKVLAAGAAIVRLWDTPSGVERSIIKGASYKANSISFNPNGNVLCISNARNLELWDLHTGAKLATLEGHEDVVNAVSFSPDGKWLASASDDQTVKLWDASSGNELRAFAGHKDKVKSLAFRPDGNVLASGSSNGSVKLWDSQTGYELQSLNPHSFQVTTDAFSPNGQILASGREDGTIKLWNLVNGSELRTLKGHKDQITYAIFSPDGQTLATSSYKSTKLWNVSTGAELFGFDEGSQNAFIFSPDGKFLASLMLTRLIVWNTRTGREIRSFGDFYTDDVQFSPDSKTLAVALSKKGNVVRGTTIKLFDVYTGAEIRSIESTEDIGTLKFSPDGKKITSSGGEKDIVWNIETGQELSRTDASGDEVTLNSQTPDGKISASAATNTNIKLYDNSSGKELATLIALDENDWAVVTPDGLFDGSPAAWKLMIWRFGNNSLDYAPLEAFFNEFYYPGLLGEIMSGKRPTAPVDITKKDRRQPQVKLALADNQPGAKVKAERNIRVSIKITDAPAGARDVRLFRNGSLVKFWPGEALPGRELAAEIPITAGENRLTAYAFNRDNIKSSDATLMVSGDESLKRPATLFILAIGVGQNINPAFKLGYAVNDAQAFSEQSKAQQERLNRYAKTEVTLLLNEKANKESILKEFRRLAEVVQPEDGLVVYFSGHGTAQGKRFYMLPYDIGYLGPRTRAAIKGRTLTEILEHSISDNELEEILRAADAGQIVMVIDACNSGQALNADDPRRGPMNSTGLAQLAYEKGMYILTASQDWEVAYESAALGHSYLTYALVEEGLKTTSADRNNDGEVLLKEWFDYATQRVPRMREERIEQAARRQGKALEEIEVKEQGKVQQPRVFYRREADVRPLIVANVLTK